MDGPAVTSIVVAAGEVGSGTAGAAGGKHFSKLTPRGVPGHPEHHVRRRCPLSAPIVFWHVVRATSDKDVLLEETFDPCSVMILKYCHKHTVFQPEMLDFIKSLSGFELRLNRIQVKGLSAGDVVVVQMKTRSKSGAFLPCEDLIRRWVVIFIGTASYLGHQCQAIFFTSTASQAVGVGGPCRSIGRQRNPALHPTPGVRST